MNPGEVQTENKAGRYHLLDSIRGITLFSMICYHGIWDLVYLYGREWSWYRGTGAYVWQQSICWSFIFLSGFCWPLGTKPLKRGLTVFAGGGLVSAVTCLIMPESRVIFGVLSFIGSCMLLMIPLDKLLKKLLPEAGICLSLILFVLTRNINRGFLGFEALDLVKLPASWYRGMIPTFLGFTSPDFFSTDYFSLFPWCFLFISGYYLHHIIAEKNIFRLSFFQWKLPFAGFLGRHSLLIYLLHQPVLYLVLTICLR